VSEFVVDDNALLAGAGLHVGVHLWKRSSGLVVLLGAEGVRPELYVLTPDVAREGILLRQTKEPPRRSLLVGLTNLKLRVPSFCRMREGFNWSFTGHLGISYGQRWHADESDRRAPARRGSLGGFGVETTRRSLPRVRRPYAAPVSEWI
jgi:hypothetical protein